MIKESIDRAGFDYAIEVAGVTTFSGAQVDTMVYNHFHFSAKHGITEEEIYDAFRAALAPLMADDDFIPSEDDIGDVVVNDAVVNPDDLDSEETK